MEPVSLKIHSADHHSFINFSLRETVPAHLPGGGDMAVDVNLSCAGFSGCNECVWFARSEIEDFLNKLRQFEAKREGIVNLSSMGAPSEYNECELQLFTTNYTGHVAVKIDLVKIQYLRHDNLCPLRVSVGFDIDAEDLLQLAAEFEMLFAIKNL